MKLKLILFFLSVSVITNAQLISIEDFGIKVDASVNLYNPQIGQSTINGIMTYDISKLQIFGGIVFSRISEYDGSNSHNRTKLTGGVLGLKFYLKSTKKIGAYFYFENTALNYHTLDAITYTIPGHPDHFQWESGRGNKAVIFQSIIGSGAEFKFLKHFSLSIDFGLGFSSWKQEFDNSRLSSEKYLSKLNSFAKQLKFGLGYKFGRH